MPAALNATDGTLQVPVTVSRVTESRFEEEVIERRALRSAWSASFEEEVSILLCNGRRAGGVWFSEGDTVVQGLAIRRIRQCAIPASRLSCEGPSAADRREAGQTPEM